MADLNKIKFSSWEGFNSVLVEIRYKKLINFFKGKKCLELGCSDGKGTSILIKYFDEITVVDGSKSALSLLKRKIKSKKLNIIHSYFEEFNTNEKFDTIIMGHVLEHLDNPIFILKKTSMWVNKNGVILITVPNALSFHRQIGVEMGLLNKPTDLNKSDLRIGHKRVYTIENLLKDIESAGLKIIKWGGILLKPFSNKQIERALSLKLINHKYIKALCNLGEKYPHISSDIYVVTRTIK